jgi:hypothetical protein
MGGLNVLHRVKGLIEFQCNFCETEVLQTEATDFSAAVEVLRAKGWTALPPPVGQGEWRHRCPDCRFGPYRRRVR